MGTRKPGPPASGSLADFPFNDGFRVPYYYKNNIAKFYELDLRLFLQLSPVTIFVFLA
jgi:hypothetical protein